jgi:hypothetical protein
VSGELTLGDVDRDGALSEGLEAIYGWSRTEFLRRASIGGAALLGALVSPGRALGQAAADRPILQFDLNWEFLQVAFYEDGYRTGIVAAMGPERERWARVLGAHERAHVAVLRKVLGGAAPAKPFFNFGGATETVDSFTKTAVAFEDLTVALLAGQASRLHDRALVAAVFGLLTTEARHAAWARRIVGTNPVAKAVDVPRPISHVRRVMASTGFVSSRPRSTATGQPRFTG